MMALSRLQWLVDIERLLHTCFDLRFIFLNLLRVYQYPSMFSIILEPFFFSSRRAILKAVPGTTYSSRPFNIAEICRGYFKLQRLSLLQT